MRISFTAPLLSLICISFSVAAWGQAKLPLNNQKDPHPLILDDAPKFIPARQLSEEEDDRREAQILFATARKKQQFATAHKEQPRKKLTEAQREKLSEALRLYQRAHRRDPQRGIMLFEIVKLGAQLNRMSVVDNYGWAAAEANPKSVGLVSVLANHFRVRGKFSIAANLNEKLLTLESAAKKTPAYVDRVMMTARLHFILGNNRRAADRFAEGLNALDHARDFGITDKNRQQILGNASETYRMMGEAFLKSMRLKEAGEAFQTAYRISRDKAGEAYQMARVHVAAGKLDEGRKQLQIYFDSGAESQGAAPYELFAEIFNKQKKTDALLADLEQRLKKSSAAGKDDLHLAGFLAGQYREAGQLDKAEPLFQHVVKAGEGKAPYANAVVQSQTSLAQIYRKMKKADKLFDVLSWSADKNGDLAALGEEAEAIVKDKPLLAALVKAAQKKKKNLNYGGDVAAALLALQHKQYKLAGEFFQAALDAKPASAPELILSWGFGLLSAEQNADAAKVFQRGIDEQLLPKGNTSYHYWLALALEFDGKTDRALTVARDAVSLSGADPRTHARVGWVYYRSKQYEKAKRAFQDLLKKFEADVAQREDPRVRRETRQARLYLSNIAVEQNDLPTAEEWLEQVLDDDPKDTSAQNDLGYLWADQNKYLNRSLRMIRNAVAEEPDNAAYLDSLGWALYRLERHDAAVAALEKAVATDKSPDAVILDHLGDAYHGAKQTKKAHDVWRRAIKAFDKKKDAEKIKATKSKLEKLSD